MSQKPWQPLNRNAGQNHDWVPCPKVGYDPDKASPHRFVLYEENYGKVALPTAIYFCLKCHTLVPQEGPRPEDQNCHEVIVREIMES